MSEKKTLRVIIASKRSDFQKRVCTLLKNSMEVEVAPSEDVCQFLLKHWGGNVCILDGATPLLESVTKLRKNHPHQSLGIIVVGDPSLPQLEIKAFEYGADYYVASLAHPQGLLLRLRTLLRRMSADHQPSGGVLNGVSALQLKESYNFSDLQIYPRHYIVKRSGAPLNLSPIQFKLLLAFVSHPEQLLSRGWLRQTVWDNENISPRSIDAQVSKLKKVAYELEPFLSNVYGKGYILNLNKQQAA